MDFIALRSTGTKAQQLMKLFNETGLNPEILRALDDLGFVEPTPVQAQSIPFLLTSDRDLMAFAQTGTGKTAAFSLPILHKADLESNSTQAIILCPTRELCLQITKDIERFSKYTTAISTVAVYGGAPIDGQIRQLKRGAQIVVGTPGRVMDMLRRRILNIATIKWLVLDEADEMLSMGFKDDLDVILAETPSTKQTLLFSATMPRELITLARKYMNDPYELATAKRNTGADNVEHHYYMVAASNRYVALKRVVDLNPQIYGIVFCRTRQETKEVAEKLMHDGYDADALHGDLSQAQRDTVMNKFRSKHLQLLIATDVAARGLDVNDLTHVINFNLPDDSEVYVHRSGRTGRAGKSGVSVSIIHSREVRRIQEIERMISKKFEHKFVPSGTEICEKQLFSLINKIEKIEVNEAEIAQFLPVVFEKLASMERDELIKRFLSVEFNRFLAYYQNAEDLNYDSKKAARPRADEKEYAPYHINVGSKNGLTTSGLISFINKHLRERDASIGRVDVQRNFSLFEIEASYCDLLEEKLNKTAMDGETIILQRSTTPVEKGERRGEGRGGDRGGYGERRSDRGGDRGGYSSRRSDDRGGERGGDRGSRRSDDRGGYSSRRSDDRGGDRGGYAGRRTDDRRSDAPRFDDRRPRFEAPRTDAPRTETPSVEKPRVERTERAEKPKTNLEEGFSWDDFEKFVQTTADSETKPAKGRKGTRPRK